MQTPTATTAALDLAAPAPTPGPELKELREKWGVTQTDVAKRMKLHRQTLNDWEKAPSIDPLRAARYRRALREIVGEAFA